MSHLWLIGMMGAGKSVVGRAIAEESQYTLVDIDAEVARRMGCSIAELWGTRGESAFRDMEVAQIADVASKDSAVIATGGGAVLRQNNVDRMRESGVVVWLVAPASVLAARLEGANVHRPLLADSDPELALAAILEERQEAYSSAAHFEVATTDRDVAAVAKEVEALWNES